MKKIKAIIFDMDGVLIDAKEWHYEALNKALCLFGYEISRYDHLVTYDGLPTRTKLEMLTRERGLPLQLHDFLNRLKQKYTLEQVYAHCKPTFHHEYTLSNLKADGYSLAVASNSIRNTIDIMLEKSGLALYFDKTISAEEVKAPKPDPDMYNKSIECFGLEPEECMILEDNEKGIMAARASGANVMTVESVNDVTLDRVYESISRFENEGGI